MAMPVHSGWWQNRPALSHNAVAHGADRFVAAICEKLGVSKKAPAFRRGFL